MEQARLSYHQMAATTIGVKPDCHKAQHNYDNNNIFAVEMMCGIGG
jgi:hypothetical protein